MILQYLVFHFKDQKLSFREIGLNSATQLVSGRAVHFVLYCGYLIAKMYQKKKMALCICLGTGIEFILFFSPSLVLLPDNCEVQLLKTRKLS